MERLFQTLNDASPTYPDVGATLAGRWPAGFHVDHYRCELGSGPDTFQRATMGLRQWRAHRRRLVNVYPPHAEIRAGATVVLTLGSPLLALAVPCRIVGVIDEPRRWGFAYGTLPGHPEEGEESFLVTAAPDGLVRFEIDAFSRPGSRLVRLSGPLARSMQRTATRGYLRTLRRFVDEQAIRNGQ